MEWGDAWSHRPPEMPARVSQVAVGIAHAAALHPDGSVTAWGSRHAATPPGLPPVRQLAAGGFHTVAALRDGGVAAWGANDLGQSAVPFALGDVKEVAAGYAHSVALRLDGSVAAWGDDSQLGPQPVDPSGRVAAGLGPRRRRSGTTSRHPDGRGAGRGRHVAQRRAA
ncbi:MAG: hypothetical protein EBU70_08335 [Actinobacteria bacterium]|nr:hypothetical protein [Actinomycetota bacterium]